MSIFDEDTKTKKVKFKKNEIPYGQDFAFHRGIPEDVVFEVKKTGNDQIQLVGHGYGITGGKNNEYGNGALYVSICNLPLTYRKKLELNDTIQLTCPNCKKRVDVVIPNSYNGKVFRDKDALPLTVVDAVSNTIIICNHCNYACDINVTRHVSFTADLG